MLTPSEVTNAGRVRSKPARTSSSHHDAPASKSTGTNTGASSPSLGEPPLLPPLRTRLVDLEHAHRPRELGPALHERVETCAEDHVLRRAALGEQVLDEPRALHDARATRRRPRRCHVGALLPAGRRRGEREADRVVEDVRRGVLLDVERAPQGGADGGAVGFVGHGQLLAMIAT
jgi:hypothetical protein